MSKVYKYEIATAPGSQVISLPKGHKILSVKVQGNGIVLYALVNPPNQTENIIIDIVMTGSEYWSEGEYLGTVMLEGGQFVLHLFKRVKNA